MRPLAVVGDSLLDRDLDGSARRLAPDAPVPVVDEPVEHSRPGGAALAALLAANDGRDVTFVTALGDDDAGRTVARLLADAGVHVMDAGLAGPTPEKVRVRAGGHPLLRLDHGRPSRITSPHAHGIAALRAAPAVLVSDYGRGMTADETVRDALTAAAADGAHIVWDPHPRGTSPTPSTRVVTPSLAEARHVDGDGDGDPATTPRVLTTLATRLRDRWGCGSVALTLGARGALLVGADGTPLAVPAASVPAVADPCGAGDRFAVTLAGALADGAVTSEAVVDAVAAATAFVVAGGASGLPLTDHDDASAAQPHAGIADDSVQAALDRTSGVRRRGGTVVATGGCFDLLHAGHVQLLDDASRLGDRLIVCLNSDASVRRLKGAGRPVVGERDRRGVLLGLAAVDDVVTFDDDTPERVLAALRPDVWVKGADYAVADMPEADLISSWGGQAVVLPYLAGRSTTSIIEEALRHVSH